MATNQKRRAYPKIPAKNWWDLRQRFQKTMPTQVTTSYLQTVLAVKEGHAANIVPQLRTVNLIGEEGRPTPLANEWRTEEGYASACKQIVDAVYPTELRDAVPPTEPDRDAAKRWFMREMGVGEGAASGMASFYVLVCQAELTNGVGRLQQGVSEPRARSKRSRETSGTHDGTSTPSVPTPLITTPDSVAKERKEANPSLHIDVQVHIPSDASLNQIDAIFASMAKHLYPNR